MEESSSSSRSSSLTASPVRRRGRGRGRGGTRHPRMRGSGLLSRGSGLLSRGLARRRGASQPQEDLRELFERQQSSIKEQVAALSVEQMRDVLEKAVERMPSLMFDILEPLQRQPGGFHPDSASSSPDWCVCGKCRDMPTPTERICCLQENCISLSANFELLVLNESVLAIARMYRRDMLVFDDEPELNKANRHQSYRQYIIWHFGRLGVGDRRVIPSCCVWKIRDKFPDPYGQYVGFVPSRIA